MTHLSAALRQYHFPGNAEQLEEAREAVSACRFSLYRRVLMRRRHDARAKRRRR
ncbi:MAG: hypothetical protein R2911_00285 [Caldilineaceae bacterium]